MVECCHIKCIILFQFCYFDVSVSLSFVLLYFFFHIKLIWSTFHKFTRILPAFVVFEARVGWFLFFNLIHSIWFKICLWIYSFTLQTKTEHTHTYTRKSTVVFEHGFSSFTSKKSMLLWVFDFRAAIHAFSFLMIMLTDNQFVVRSLWSNQANWMNRSDAWFFCQCDKHVCILYTAREFNH